MPVAVVNTGVSWVSGAVIVALTAKGALSLTRSAAAG